MLFFSISMTRTPSKFIYSDKHWMLLFYLFSLDSFLFCLNALPVMAFWLSPQAPKGLTMLLVGIRNWTWNHGHRQRKLLQCVSTVILQQILFIRSNLWLACLRDEKIEQGWVGVIHTRPETNKLTELGPVDVIHAGDRLGIWMLLIVFH